MRVALKRNLFLGGQRFRADPQGVDLPDIVDGRKLILHKEWLAKKKEAKTDEELEKLEEEYLSLPKDAELYKEPVVGIKSLNTRGKTIPPQFPVNPTQSPPPGPTPTEGSASMAIDMVDNERLVDDMNDPKTPKLTADEAREKVERDKAKELAEQEAAKSESTVVKASDRHAIEQATRRDKEPPVQADANTLSGLTRAAEKEQAKDPKTLSEMNKGQPNVTVKK